MLWDVIPGSALELDIYKIPSSDNMTLRNAQDLRIDRFL